MSGTGMKIEHRLNATALSHRNRLTFFAKIIDYKNSVKNGGNTILADLIDIIRDCGYKLTDFENNANIKLSTITTVDQLPLKHRLTGTLTINQSHHQSNINLIEINTTNISGQDTGTIVLSAIAPGQGKTVGLLTENDLPAEGGLIMVIKQS